jgi:hypothetical protein
MSPAKLRPKVFFFKEKLRKGARGWEYANVNQNERQKSYTGAEPEGSFGDQTGA